MKKGSLSSNIPTKIIKESDDLFATFITENFNLCLETFKLILVKLPSPTVNVKSFWVSLLIVK